MPVALARTWCTPEDDDESVLEVRAAHQALIARAQRWIYIENQYLSSSEISEALAKRLEEADGPEIVIVLPAATPGWLEQATMDKLRNRVIGELRKADRHQRLRIVSPGARELGDTVIMVHSKLMVVDGEIARVGSANLSARSMSLDTECDLVVADRDAALALCTDLLAEHLDADVEALRACLEEQGLVATLERFHNEERTLRPFDVSVSDIEEALLIPVADLADMERPIMRTAETGSTAMLRRVPDALTSRIDTLASSSDAWTLAGLRLIPIAPFSLINLVVGASGIGLRKFMLGTLIALAPTTVIICLSVDRARAVLAGEPVFNGWILAALAAAGVATGAERWRRAPLRRAPARLRAPRRDDRRCHLS